MEPNRKFLTSTGVLLKTLADEPVKTTSTVAPFSKSNLSNTSNNKQFFSQIHSSDIAILPSTIGQPPPPKRATPQQQQQQQQKPHQAVTAKNVAINKKTTIPVVNISDDIEIVGEIAQQYPNNATQQQQQQSEESRLRVHLAKTYGQAATSTVHIAAKPQSNFINNVTCLNRLMAMANPPVSAGAGNKSSSSDLYASKLRRFRPYSNLRPHAIVSAIDRGLDNDDENENPAGGDGDETTASLNRKVIVIDDSNEEMHKPWINPELIKLIKQRNLLQAKLNESRGVTDSAVNDELIKKFKNLRNKVTKLVKKARKDYLAKYGQENGLLIASSSSTSMPTAAGSPKLGVESSSTSLKSTESLTHHQPSGETNNATSSSTTSSTTTLTLSASSTTTTTTTTQQQPVISSSDPLVNELLAKIVSSSASFLKDQSTLMGSLYSTYYTQYVEQYTKAQQEAANEAAATDGSGYDALQKQAAQYAKQQRSVQNQLEATLVQCAQQLVQEVAAASADKAFADLQQKQKQLAVPPQPPPLQAPPPPPPPFVLHPFNQLNLQSLHHF